MFFSASIENIVFSALIWCIALIDLCMLNQLLHYWDKSYLVVVCTPFLHVAEFAFLELLKIFMPIFIRHIAF